MRPPYVVPGASSASREQDQRTTLGNGTAFSAVAPSGPQSSSVVSLPAPSFRTAKSYTPLVPPRLGRYPPRKRDPPSIGGPKSYPPLGFSKSSVARRCPMSWAFPNDANLDWNSQNRGVLCRNGPAPGHLDIGGGHGGLELVDPPGDPPSLVAPKAGPPLDPLRANRVPSPGAMSHELGHLKRGRNGRILLELAGRGVPYRDDPHPNPPHPLDGGDCPRG
jgi:hypothetical protein